MWRNQPHGQRQVVGSTLKLEPFLSRKEETKEGYRTPRPLEVRWGRCVSPHTIVRETANNFLDLYILMH